MKRLLLFVAAVVVCAPVLLAAQSLADLARAEEARRKNVRKAGKVYTNDSLKSDFTQPTPPPATSSAAPEAGTPPDQPQPGGAPSTPENEQQGEAYWRNRLAAARAQLQRSQLFAEALQSRLNALTTDFVNRDDPAQRAVIERDRQKAVAELDRVKKEIAEQTKAVDGILEEARKAGVPPGWLR